MENAEKIHLRQNLVGLISQKYCHWKTISFESDFAWGKLTQKVQFFINYVDQRILRNRQASAKNNSGSKLIIFHKF